MHDCYCWQYTREQLDAIGMVGQSLSHVIDVVVGLFEEGSHVVVIDAVVHDIALASRFDESAIP